MRSQVILRRTRAIVKSTAVPHRALLSSTRVPRYPRKDSTATNAPHLAKRASSSVTPTSAGPTPFAPASPPDNPNEGPSDPKPEPGTAVTEDAEKPKRKPRSTTKETESSSIPPGLSILWHPDDVHPTDPSLLHSEPLPPNTTLPPPEIFHEVLTNLHITLHPQTQHRAAYTSPSGPPVEPTLALYCPIEGGDYIIDETVRELGRSAGAEVVVLDAVQLAAGECGHFGKAASVLQLPNNPLHFAAPATVPPRVPTNTQVAAEEEDDDDLPPSFMPSSALTLHVLAPLSRSGGRTVVASRRTSPSSLPKMKAFFDELINMSAPTQGGSAESPQRLPRIIYIRDFPTLAASSSSWYPALLASVRQRRQGALARPSSPVANPTTIIFGMTPSIAAPASSVSSSPGPQGLFNLLMNRQSPSQVAPGLRSGKAEYTESEIADKARERRLRERLRRWERGDSSVYGELPQLFTASEEDPSTSDVVVVGGPDNGMGGLPPVVAQAIGARMASRGDPSDGEKGVARFFRTSFVVPSVRSPILEKACRMDRRREINELTMRMGVAAVGGVLEKMETNPDDPRYLEEGNEPDAAAMRMWEHWGRSIEVWSNVRKIADRAVGKVIASQKSAKIQPWKTTLDATPVPWDMVYEAWTVHRAAHDMRKAWVQQSSSRTLREDEEDDTERVVEEEFVDETIERVKRDPDLDKHEQRLLGCIVDTASISTTFSHVHLPPHTIDSVRTIVSLPLLHPAAFQHGILKEHTMTGCLLFGPPGTGKTLVVRALAKEAGCRMLSISPSDVMDMYVGEGEKLVRAVFSLARRLSPCVVFIDELDALFGARAGMGRESGGAIAHRGVITEFMQEMDGLKSSKGDNVIVIGATNRPFDLDDAVLRRLPRRLLVDLPGEKEREEILKILLRDEPLAPDVDLKALAHKTETFSGSDLKHLCVSAALDAVKERVDVPWRPAKSTLHNATGVSPQTAATEVPGSHTPSEIVTGGTSDSTIDPASTSEPPSEPVTVAPESPRTLHWRNFIIALKEITPSSSESLGSLAELRKWNDEFGEGRKEKKKQVWGKGRFGFTVQALESNDAQVQTPGTVNDKQS